MKRPISPFYYGLRVYTNHSIDGYTVIDLVNSSALSWASVLYYYIESWKRDYTDHWMRGKKHHLEWDSVEYRYAMNNTMKLLHNLQARSST